MNLSDFGQWYYAMYVVPGGAALLLLALSALGGRHGHGRHHAGAASPHSGGHIGHGHGMAGHSHAAASHAHSARPTPSSGSAAKQAPSAHSRQPSGKEKDGPSGTELGHRNHGFLQPSRNEPDPDSQVLSPSGTGGVGRGPGLRGRVDAFLGAGAVPPSLVGSAGLLGWGLGGFWTTRILSASHPVEAIFVPAALIAACGGALISARLTAAIGARLLPRSESFVIDRVDLCGLTGRVSYPISISHGRIQVYDVYGTLHDPQARIAKEGDDIARGDQVLVVDYDAARDVFIVEKMP